MKPPVKKNINTIYKNNEIICKSINSKKVLLIYTTRNDFDEFSLLCSMNQNYSNYEVFILDDSNDEKYINEINKFVSRFSKGVSVIRRRTNNGFKAGNINNFLSKFKNYDYFVLLDADEIIPNDFIEKSIKYFDDEKVGIVQSNHTSNRYSNLFERIGSIGIFPGASMSLTMRNKYGIPTLYGHGAMISKDCYETNGGFPEIVSEDIGFLIDSLYNGYKIIFANDIICDERFPVDYLSFRKRSVK